MQLVRIWSLGLLCLLGLLVLVVVAVVLLVVLAGRSRRRPAVPRSRPPSPRPRGQRPLPARPSDPDPLREGYCPECAAELPADSPGGLCPQCLLQGALNSPPGAPEERKGGTTPYPGPFTAPDPADLAPHFPQLEILGLIGQGGMGAVYKARQTKLDRLVALKVLPPEWGRDPAFAERFAREARTLARLNHPHIVAVHDFGESGGLYYLVMEFVDGLNLREALQAGHFQPEQALAVVPQLCDALQYAHEEGVVHRDIKPENILLDRRGRVKVADFGLAKLLNRPRADFTLTGSRQVMGTLDYMAPEQRSRPLEIDHRADIYSLGVVFYEMLTGELPLGRFPVPSEKAAVDARLDDVVLRALETDPGRRYQSASAVKVDVESIVGRAAPPAHGAAPAGGARERTVVERALHQVRGPAGGLLLAGIVTPLGWLMMFLHTPPDPPLLVCLLMCFISLAPGAVLIAGALKMRRCEAYELGFIASILAMTPFTGLAWMFITLPMGLWALLVLCKRPVRDGFALRLQGWPAETRGGLLGARPSGSEAGSLRDRARRRLAWPAVALVVAGILQCVCQVLVAVPLTMGAVEATYDIMTGRSAFREMQGGSVALVLLTSAPGLAVVAAWFFLGLYVGISMVRAALRMTRLESYRLAVKGSLLALLPCNVSFLLTLPAGLWAFLVLRDLDVEAAFAPAPPKPQSPAPPPAPRATGPFQRKARSFLNSMLAMFVSRPGKGPRLEEEERLPERS